MMSILSWLFLIAILPPAGGDGDATPIPLPILPPARPGEPPRDERAAQFLAVRAVLDKEEGEYDQLEKIVIHYEITNVSEAGRLLYLGADRYEHKEIKIKVLNEAFTHEAPMTFHHLLGTGVAVGGTDRGVKALGPSEGLRGEVVANLLRDMTMPGEYTIVVEVPFLVHHGMGLESAVASSNPLKVKVVEIP